jgi:hypothetical protein
MVDREQYACGFICFWRKMKSYFIAILPHLWLIFFLQSSSFFWPMREHGEAPHRREAEHM